jgi:hypothetical protein
MVCAAIKVAPQFGRNSFRKRAAPGSLHGPTDHTHDRVVGLPVPRLDRTPTFGLDEGNKVGNKTSGNKQRRLVRQQNRKAKRNAPEFLPRHSIK